MSHCLAYREENLLVKKVEEVGLFLCKSLVGRGEALLIHLEICLLRLVLVKFAVIVAPETFVLGLSHTHNTTFSMQPVLSVLP